ncbi:DoxX family protein [Flavobacterium rakeshii]|uniref:DoxX family protein n=1 Tax=Flavobacterium rakeshii TaxID=1038845 RepID=A0A6N8HEX0_9FLAO|nr:DoxX family protein [Flavobacterium rakeshii]MUV04247.1 DoxX family protein [Flavobacterium rakeshii]
MKKNKIIYWITTSLAMLMGGVSGFLYLFLPQMKEAFQLMGFPDYFRIELAIAKIIGLFVILLPQVPAKFKEWAYTGFGIVFISAIVAHTVVQGFATAIAPIVVLVLLSISYTYYHKLQAAKVKAN